MDVIGIGIPCVDLIASVKEISREGRGTRLLDYSWQGGGIVPSALVALARLGAQCGMVGVVGDCPFGKFCRDDFERHGIDTSRLITQTGEKTPFSIVLSEMAHCERSFIYNQGTIHNLTVENMDREYIASCKYLHIAGMNDSEMVAAKWVKEEGGQVVIDAGSYRPGLDKLLPLIDVFIGSEYYYREICENSSAETVCKKIMDRGPGIVVFTFGANGCVAADEKGFYTIPGFDVNVVDTTGAGDVFHGAFIYGLLQKWDTKKTARFSNAVSAIKCTRIGGRAGIPTVETTAKFIESGVIDYTEIDKRVDFYKRGIFT